MTITVTLEKKTQLYFEGEETSIRNAKGTSGCSGHASCAGSFCAQSSVSSGPQATGCWVLPTALACRPSWKVMTVAVHSQGLSTALPTCGLTDGHSQTALGAPSPRQPAASSVLQGPQDSRAALQARHALWVS